MSATRVLRVIGGVILILASFSYPVWAQGISGGCTATVNGRNPASLTEKHPLLVRKDEQVTLSGQVPPAVAGAGRDVRSTTEVYVDVFGFPVRVRTVSGKGATWGGSVDLPKVIRDLASGVYRVSGEASGSPGGWKCSGSGYMKLDSNPLTKPVTYVAGGMAAGGGALVAGGRKPGKRKDRGGRALVDLIREIGPDLRKEFGADASMLIALVVIWILFMSVGYDFFAAAAVAAPAGASRRVPGRVVRGFFGGLFFGLGLAIVLQQFSLIAADKEALIPVLATAVIGALRAWWGTPLSANPPEPQPAAVVPAPDDPAPPTHEPEPVG